jgi:carbon storage regulator
MVRYSSGLSGCGDVGCLTREECGDPLAERTHKPSANRQAAPRSLDKQIIHEASAWPRKEPRMLVLSRQRDQTIMIGDDIEITVVDIRGDKVRLGINAPSQIPVHRKEVYEAIKRENRAAASVKPEDIANVAGTPANHSGASKER